MLLNSENCPDVSQRRIDSVNELSDEQLRLEIERGRSSRFGEKMLPVLRLALKLRQDAQQSIEREQDLEIAKRANAIAAEALEEAKRANGKSDKARVWSGVAILVSVILAVIQFTRGAS